MLHVVISKRKYLSPLLSLLVFFLSLMLVNIGCSPDVPNTSKSTNFPTPIESPKGPGAANLTATARSTPIPTVCPSIGAALSTSTTGWKIYKDSRFPFQFAFPPNWRAGSTISTSIEGTNSTYLVQVFPPTSTARFDPQSSVFDVEHFEMSITLTGPVVRLSDDHSYIPEKTPTLLGTTKTILYDRASEACEEIERFAGGDFGQHYYEFRMKSIPEKAGKDLALFLSLLQSFTYVG